MLFSFFSKTKLENSDIRAVIHGSGVTLILKVTGALLSFLVAVLLAQSLGIHGLGVYFLSFSILIFTSNLVRFGLDNAILKFAGSAYQKDDRSSIIGLYRRSILFVTLSTSLVSVFLFFSANFLSNHIFNIPELELILKYLGLVILPLALFNIHVSFFQAMGGVIKSALLLGVVVPLLMIFGILLLTTFGWNNVNNMVALYGFNCLLNLLVCYWIFSKLLHSQKSAYFPTDVLLSACIPMFWIVLAENIAVHAPQLILGAYWHPEEVAIFSTCLRIATLISFILTSVSRVMAPKLSALHSKGDLEQLARLSTVSSTIMFFVASLLSMIIILLSEQLLSWFGSSFISAKFILQLFVVAQLILVINGLGKIVLQMAGYEWLCKNISFIHIFLILIFSFVLIPSYSSVGAVLSLLLAGMIVTFITFIVIKKELGFYLIGFSWIYQKRKI